MGANRTLVVYESTWKIVEDDENTASGWERQTLDKVSKAILAAHEHAVDAQLGIGYGSADVGYNRRKLKAD